MVFFLLAPSPPLAPDHQDVKHDPWNAARWFETAEKLEQTEEDAKNDNAFSGMEIGPQVRQALLSARDDRAVVIINADGEIQMTNQAAHDMFGWNKAELRGKNINIIIPPPTNEHHAAYVRNYIQSGEWQ